jgi:amino-acid N-acetyltransferase
VIRRAFIFDVPQMARIINDAAEYGLMLHRSHAYLYEHIRDFKVAVDGGKGGKVIGLCGLNIVWANLAEVYALAVDPAHRGKGLGSKLVKAVMAEARRLKIAKLMTLTYEQRFFERLGFKIVDRQTLPLKVWSQCVYCLKNQACDEIAMLKVLEGVPDAAAIADEAELSRSEHEYDVPVTIKGVRLDTHEARPLMDAAPVE